MMGAGKSSVGRALASLSGRPFQDTDLILQQRLGRPIPQLFSLYGEQAFRDHENAVLRSLQPQPCVLATGGGIVMREDNWAEIRRLGTSVYLKVGLERLLDRLEQSKKRRPLLETEAWEERVESLLEVRGPHYAKADLTVEVLDEPVDRVAERVFQALRGWPPS
jgi:shikimate kinase